MIVRKVENFLEKHIEGFFNRKFSSCLQTVEVLKRLEKEMYFKKVSKNAVIYVPNYYTIYLSINDYNHLYSDEFCESMEKHIINIADKDNYVIQGSLCVKCNCDKKLKKGCFCIEPEFNMDYSEKENRINTSEIMSTIVYDKECVISNLLYDKNETFPAAQLAVISGDDIGKKISIGKYRINIGRRENNECILTDKNASRLHAYILYNEGIYTLYDANSLNGTYLNDERIEKSLLNDGDKIKVGNTVIVYEVK